MTDHEIGMLANTIPGEAWLPAGDIAQRYVDVVTSDRANKVNAAIDTKAQGDLSSLYTTGQMIR